MNWAMRLNQYDFNIEYIKGEDNVEADFLSRNPNFSSENQPNEDQINIGKRREDRADVVGTSSDGHATPTQRKLSPMAAHIPFAYMH